MPYKTLTLLVALIATLALAVPALAAAPQLRVNSAGYAFDIYSDAGQAGELGNWRCDAQSELNGLACYSPYAASYLFAGDVSVTQDPISGTFVAVTQSGARDGGFASVTGDGELLSFLHDNARGGLKTLRETTISDDSFLGCTHLTNPTGKCHWVQKDALWGKQSAGLDNLYTFVFVVDTGALGTSKNSWFVYGASADGVTNFQWTKVFEMVRPGGNGTGSMNLTNNFRVMQDPSNDARWIGLMAWTFNDGTTSDSGTTPIYILPNQGRFGILFEHAGWCEYNMFTRFTGFNDNNSCAGGTFVESGGTWQGPLGDRFYKAPGLDKDVADLSLINGQALVLKDVWQNDHRCKDWSTLDDDQDGTVDYSSEAHCAQVHANCGPGLDRSLYYTRSRDQKIIDKRKPRTWTVREVNYSTWSTSQSALSWNGGAVTIIDSGLTLPEFKINPTDNPTIGGYHGGRIVQHSNGSILMYVPVKHSLCEPAEDGLSSWDRFPTPGSGDSNLWLKLVVVN